jgi:hypothetical protein
MITSGVEHVSLAGEASIPVAFLLGTLAGMDLGAGGVGGGARL